MGAVMASGIQPQAAKRYEMPAPGTRYGVIPLKRQKPANRLVIWLLATAIVFSGITLFLSLDTSVPDSALDIFASPVSVHAEKVSSLFTWNTMNFDRTVTVTLSIFWNYSMPAGFILVLFALLILEPFRAPVLGRYARGANKRPLYKRTGQARNWIIWAVSLALWLVLLLLQVKSLMVMNDDKVRLIAEPGIDVKSTQVDLGFYVTAFLVCLGILLILLAMPSTHNKIVQVDNGGNVHDEPGI